MPEAHDAADRGAPEGGSLVPAGEASASTAVARVFTAIALMQECHRSLRLKYAGRGRSAAKVLRDGEGLCGDFAIVLAAWLAARGLPVRIIRVLTDDPPVDTHALVECAIDHRWHTFDPTFNRYLPGAAVADLLVDPSLSATVVRYPASPDIEWGSRYYDPAFIGRVTRVGLINGPSRIGPNVFSRAEFLARRDALDADCLSHPNRRLVFRAQGWRWLSRGLLAIACERGEATVLADGVAARALASIAGVLRHVARRPATMHGQAPN